MQSALERIRSNPLFRAAIAAPIAIMIVFSLFNLTGAADQSRLSAAMILAVVDLDEGLPGMPAPLSEQLLGGIRGALPIGTLAIR